MDYDLDEINNNNNIGITALLEDTVRQKKLEQITSLKLQVPMTVNRLCMLSTYVPNLIELDLTDSYLSSFRDFAFKLNNLKILRVASCNLKSLDGIWNVPNIEELYAPDNDLSDILLCSALSKLVVLDLTRNKIINLLKLHFLNFCKELHTLTLTGCPVTKIENFEKRVFEILPHIKELNGNQLTEPLKIEDHTSATIDMVVCGNITAALRSKKKNNFS
ncbi:acidic leucine-rich nuclear phosphoprotein 32-related protein-like [Daktulosphaira vitifoliae]|uniref:acidic leucine-rich nuclear phosphoprotein 32-related protein-like n=1 Tax=Daktulosphaira vitifoliae TaxID=58002 RepID=UPI0021AAA560|nr:acidic leucine-rich nuclear phosphoprotein 32-related protein-like [Daktulosphaira vitifoliae]